MFRRTEWEENILGQHLGADSATMCIHVVVDEPNTCVLARNLMSDLIQGWL